MLQIPTEPIGSIPRPPELLEAIEREGPDSPGLQDLYRAVVEDTVQRFEATGSPVVTDGEQRKYHNFWTYSVHGLPNTAPDGFVIPFAAGHTRRMPRLVRGPFRYLRYADSYLEVARAFATRPLEQAVISPSALSLMYPAEGIPGYSRDEFISADVDYAELLPGLFELKAGKFHVALAGERERPHAHSPMIMNDAFQCPTW